MQVNQLQSTKSLALPPLVFACDERFAMPLAAALRSLAESNTFGWPLKVHILSSGICERTQKLISKSLPPGSASLHWEQVELKSFDGFQTASHISRTTYARLLLPAVFPECSSRLLYLDSDVLVLGNLAYLATTDLQGRVLGAVLDGMDSPVKAGHPRFKGVPSVSAYFNAGVLLIDLKRWREEKITERALEYLKRNPNSPYSDQDALNVACDGFWTPLPEQWNFQNHYGRDIARMLESERPRIVHFVTNSKPWIPAVRNPNARLYDSFRSRTCFARSGVQRIKDEIERFRAGVGNVLARRGISGRRDSPNVSW
jgi:lipopolysaccharide biosynthesis glycosyltransferase